MLAFMVPSMNCSSPVPAALMQSPDHDTPTTMLDCRQDTLVFVLLNTPAPHSHLRPCNTNESHDTGERKWLIGPKLTLHDFSPIFHSPTGFDKSPANARNRRQIGARSRAVWIIKDAIWGLHNPAVWMSSDWKIHCDDLQPMREQDTGQREVRGGLFLFFFYKGSIRIYRTGRLHEDEEGGRVFHINNILL